MDHATPTADDEFDFDALLEASSLGAPRVTAALGTATPDAQLRFAEAARGPQVQEGIPAEPLLPLYGQHRAAAVLRGERESLPSDTSMLVSTKRSGVYALPTGSEKTAFLSSARVDDSLRLAIVVPGTVYETLDREVRHGFVRAELFAWLFHRIDSLRERHGRHDVDFPEGESGDADMERGGRCNPGSERLGNTSFPFSVLFNFYSRRASGQFRQAASAAASSSPVFVSYRYGNDASAVDADVRAAKFISTMDSMKRAALWLSPERKDRRQSAPAWWERILGDPTNLFNSVDPHGQKLNLGLASPFISAPQASPLQESAHRAEAAALQLRRVTRSYLLHQGWLQVQHAPDMQQSESEWKQRLESSGTVLSHHRHCAMLRLMEPPWTESPLASVCAPLLAVLPLHAAFPVAGLSSGFWQLSDCIWRPQPTVAGYTASFAREGQPPLALRWFDTSPDTEPDHPALVKASWRELTSAAEESSKQPLQGGGGASQPLRNPREEQVLAELAGLLHLDRQGNSTVGLKVCLRYRVTDPYAVDAVFEPGRENVTWTFARDLLKEGMHTQAGEGDVKVWTHSAVGSENARTYLELSPSPDKALLSLPHADVMAFVERAFAMVPEGTEQEYLGASLRDLERQLHQFPAPLDSCD